MVVWLDGVWMVGVELWFGGWWWLVIVEWGGIEV